MRHGSDVEARDSDNEATPLQLAADFDHPDCVKELLDKYVASINATDKFGRTALHRAAFKGNIQVVKLLTSYSQCDVNAKKHNGKTAADVARDKGHIGVVDHLTSKSSITDVTSSLPSQLSFHSGTSFLASRRSADNVMSQISIESGASCASSTQSFASPSPLVSQEPVVSAESSVSANGVKEGSKVYP